MSVTVIQAPTPPGGTPTLSVTPSNFNAGSSSGSGIAFYIENTRSGTMTWSASVISGNSWLSILSPTGSITGNGAIIISYTANSGTSSRVGAIQVTAPGATGSPMSVTVTR